MVETVSRRVGEDPPPAPITPQKHIYPPKVIVPFTRLHPALQPALEQQEVQAEYVRLETREAYWELLCRLWDEKQTFVLVEHDILPWPGAIDDLILCAEPWCAQPYKALGMMQHMAFGCTKISSRLIRELGPETILKFEDHSWRKLDTQFLIAALPRLPHRHGPPVLHMAPGHWGTFKLQTSSFSEWLDKEVRTHEVLLRDDLEYRNDFIKFVLMRSPTRDRNNDAR